MLETMLEGQALFVVMGTLAAGGVISKCIVNVTLKRLVRAAGNMNKSSHPFMRLVRAKFEHASMISDKVENVKVFVDKYLYEYKVFGGTASRISEDGDIVGGAVPDCRSGRRRTYVS